MSEDNDIDQLFRDRLSDPEIPFNEMNWEKMERKLDQGKKKRVISLWVYTACGIAAVLMISLYLIFLAPVSPDQQLVKDPLTNRVVKPGKEFVPLTLVDSLTVVEKSTGTQDKYVADHTNFSLAGVAPVSSGTGASLELSAGNKGIVSTSPLEGIVSPLANSSSILSNPTSSVVTRETTIAANTPSNPAIPAVETDSAILARKANALAQSKDPFERVEASEIARSVKNKMEKSLQPQNDLILSAMAAPDVSFAKSSKPAKISSNLGVLATYAFTPKISMTSGAIYSRKFYNSGGGSPWGNNGYVTGSDWQVSADCNVLDIPLNVNYKIFNKKKLSVSLNTGLSSYFMLKEKYQFTSGQGAAEKVTNLEIDNQNQHLFGIANVSVSFDHQLTPSVSVGVQPFAKLPLTGIGYGDANLKSTGVSFSLNIGLFPAKKPGKYAAVRY